MFYNRRRLTIEDVKARLSKVHGYVVMIDETTYINMYTKCRFIDKDFGEWFAVPNGVINRGQGHWLRGKNKSSKSQLKPIDRVLSKLQEVHKGVVSLDVGTYTNMGTKCKFIDIDFGEWWAYPQNVIDRGQGHRNRMSEKKKQTNLARFGVEHTFQSEIVKKKTISTNITKFGVANVFQNEWIKEKSKQTCMQKYGVKYCSQSSVVREKGQQTNLRKLGVRIPAQSRVVMDKIKSTTLKHLGVEHPSQNKSIALRAARSNNKSIILLHWKTGEELVCTASYEIAVVSCLNVNQIEFEWQPRVFRMPADENGKVRTYRPDMYLPEGRVWVEIKGYFRKDAREKWDWFHSTHSNSELWDKAKLKEFGIL